MSIQFIRIVDVRTNTPDQQLKRMPQGMKAAHLKICNHWQDEFLPDHFGSAAPGKYQHTSRTSKYLRRKRALAKIGKVESGGVLDNVFSGDMRRALLNTRQEIRADAHKGEIILRGPRHMFIRMSGRPDKMREIKTVTVGEKRDLSAEGNLALLAALRANRATETTNH
jgi:hypothetical protein